MKIPKISLSRSNFLLAICLFLAVAARAEDDDPKTITFGFHNRGNQHPAGGISAASSGTTNLQNPLNDRTALALGNKNVTVTSGSLTSNYQISDTTRVGAFYVEVEEWWDSRGAITLQLSDAAGNSLGVLSGPGEIYQASENDGKLVDKIQATAATAATAKGNAGGYVVLKSKELKVEFVKLNVKGSPTIVAGPINGQTEYSTAAIIEGKVKVTPTPTSVSDPVEIRLVQSVCGGHKMHPGGDVLECKFPDNNIHRDGSLSGDQISALGDDSPVVGFTQSQWNDVQTITTIITYNVYLQWKHGDGAWKTVGKVQWKWVGGYNRTTNGVSGGVQDVTGEASSEDPKIPDDPWQ